MSLSIARRPVHQKFAERDCAWASEERNIAAQSTLPGNTDTCAHLQNVRKHAQNNVQRTHGDEGMYVTTALLSAFAERDQFMQRAAAKSSPSTPSTPNGPPAKKARLSNGASAVGTSDHEIIQSGLDAEEAKRQAALDKAAEHAGETKWVLSFKDPLEGKRQDAMNVRQAGFAELDAEDDDEDDDDEDVKPIRMQFGGGVKKKADVRTAGIDYETLLT
jgi:hypothetical protein